MFLIYGDVDLIVRGYIDTNFQSNGDNFKSKLGYVFTMNGGVVCWKSSKQEMIGDSIIESKYIIASNGS